MNGTLHSILIGTGGLSFALLLAVFFAIGRRPLTGDLVARRRTLRLFLIGLAAYSLHFMEEYLTGFQERFPAILGLAPWPDRFFVAFNLSWLSVWILSAAGLQKGLRLALFPVWFFAIAAIGNGVAHPALMFAVQGYFPGLFTSPVVGLSGVLLFLSLQKMTRESSFS